MTAAVHLGSIGLVGSGEYLPEMAEFEKLLLDDGIRNQKAPTFVQIPTAAGRESRDRILYWQELGERQANLLGVEPKFLPILIGKMRKEAILLPRLKPALWFICLAVILTTLQIRCEELR